MAESWRASTDSEGGWTSIFAEHRRLIAHVFVGDNEPEDNLMMRANLIAAAPDLLEACETLKAWLGEADEVTGHDRRIWDMLDAAIAKATGARP